MLQQYTGQRDEIRSKEVIPMGDARHWQGWMGTHRDMGKKVSKVAHVLK